MISCYYGSVNRWECDENDHLNVRFYAQKVHQAVSIFIREVSSEPAVTVEITSQHIRFVAEARMATPIRVDCGLLNRQEGGWAVLSLVVNHQTDAPLAGFITTLSGVIGEPHDKTLIEAPDWARPKGIDPRDPFPAPERLQTALQRGFQTMGRGLIGTEECDGRGLMLPHVYIGRISDGMPNLWAFTADADMASARGASSLGGAALEYRLHVDRPMLAGDVFRHASGIRAIGNKTQHMVHLLWNETRDELSAMAEAIGVAMDLQTRRAVPISPSRRQALERLHIRPE